MSIWFPVIRFRYGLTKSSCHRERQFNVGVKSLLIKPHKAIQYRFTSHGLAKGCSDYEIYKGMHMPSLIQS